MSKFGVIENIIESIEQNSTLTPEALQATLYEAKVYHRRIPKELLAEIVQLLGKDYNAAELIAERKEKASLYGFDVDVYAKLLAYTKLSQFLEGSLKPNNDAYALTIIFGDAQKALSYLREYNKDNPQTVRSIEEACSFSLPEGTNWDIDAWRVIFEKNLIYKKFRRSGIIGNAEKIQEKLLSTGYVLNNQDDNDIELNTIIDEIKKIKVELESKNGETKLNDDVLRTLRKEIAQVAPEQRASLSKLEKEIKILQKEKTEDVASPKLIIEREALKSKIEKAVPFEKKQALAEVILLQKTLKSDVLALKAEMNKLQSQLAERKKQLPILLKDVSSKKLEKLALKIQYSDAKQDKEAARLFKKYGILDHLLSSYIVYKKQSQSQKEVYEKLREVDPSLLKTDEILPEVVIDGAKNGCEGYYIVKLNKDDPKGAVLGHITACCQSIDAQGMQCVVHGITNVNGGFYVLCKGTPPTDGNTHLIAPKNIIAQSWAWRGENNTVVLDSIEAQPNILSSAKNVETIRKMYHLLGEHLVTKTEITAVNVGQGLRTPRSIGYTSPNRLQPVKIQSLVDNHPHYPDSEIQREIARKGKPLYNEFFINLDQALEKYIQMTLESKKEYDENILVEIILRMGKPKHLEKLLGNLVDPHEMKDYLQKNECFQKVIDYRNLDFIPYFDKLDLKIALKAAIIDASHNGDANLTKALLDLAPKDSIEYLGNSLQAQLFPFSVKNPELTKALLAAWEERVNTHGIDINQKDSVGNTLLMYAINAGDVHFARKIILSGKAHLPSLDSAKHDNAEILRLLFKKTKDINQVNSNNENVLASYIGQSPYFQAEPKLVNYLVNKGAQVTEKTLANAKAARYDVHQPESYKRLLNIYLETQLPSEEEINIHDKQGKTALMRALDTKNDDLVMALLDKGADIHSKDNSGWSVLHYAVISGQIKFIEKMLELSPDIIALDAPILEEGTLGYGASTSLEWAIRTENVEMVKFLLENGYPVRAKTSYPPLEGMINLDNPTTKKIITLLLQYGVSPFADPTFETRNPLHFEAIIKLWLNEMLGKLEKDPSTKYIYYDKSRTLLMLAIEYGDINLIKKFIQKGASVNTQVTNHLQTVLKKTHISQKKREELQSIQMFLNSQTQIGPAPFRAPLYNYNAPKQTPANKKLETPSKDDEPKPKKPPKQTFTG